MIILITLTTGIAVDKGPGAVRVSEQTTEGIEEESCDVCDELSPLGHAQSQGHIYIYTYHTPIDFRSRVMYRIKTSKHQNIENELD